MKQMLLSDYWLYFLCKPIQYRLITVKFPLFSSHNYNPLEFIPTLKPNKAFYFNLNLILLKNLLLFNFSNEWICCLFFSENLIFRFNVWLHIHCIEKRELSVNKPEGVGHQLHGTAQFGFKTCVILSLYELCEPIGCAMNLIWKAVIFIMKNKFSFN